MAVSGFVEGPADPVSLELALDYNCQDLGHGNLAGATDEKFGLRAAEYVVATFFLYAAVLSWWYPLPTTLRIMSLGAPVVFLAAAWGTGRLKGQASKRLRDWLIPAAVLPAYWEMGWFAGGFDTRWQKTWLDWDGVLLHQRGLSRLMESVPAIPWLSELMYLLLYLIPPASLAVLYHQRAWDRVNRYLLTFAAGTFVTYAALPLLPVQSPRLAFPGQDIPAVTSVWREINIWILDHLDISTSVFPSGHVAVAFSSAFGMQQALPGKGPAVSG